MLNMGINEKYYCIFHIQDRSHQIFSCLGFGAFFFFSSLAMMQREEFQCKLLLKSPIIHFAPLSLQTHRFLFIFQLQTY